MARSLNRVQLIGNLTRDPELRYTPSGNAVVSFSLATNRSWTTETGEKKEEADFHRIIAWNKLAELCSQFLTKGRKVYVEGRLSTRSWQGQDGAQRSTTEVIIDDMILLDKRPDSVSHVTEEAHQEEEKVSAEQSVKVETASNAAAAKAPERAKAKEEARPQDDTSEEVVPDDIPF